MKQKFKLNPTEKTIQDVLRTLLVIIFILLFKGVYNEYNHIDQNKILVPSVLLSCFLFCMIYSINAFTTGNLVNNWANTQIYIFIFNHMISNMGVSSDKAMKITTRVFGVFTLIMAAACIAEAFIYYYK